LLKKTLLLNNLLLSVILFRCKKTHQFKKTETFQLWALTHLTFLKARFRPCPRYFHHRAILESFHGTKVAPLHFLKVMSFFYTSYKKFFQCNNFSQTMTMRKTVTSSALLAHFHQLLSTMTFLTSRIQFSNLCLLQWINILHQQFTSFPLLSQTAYKSRSLICQKLKIYHHFHRFTCLKNYENVFKYSTYRTNLYF